MGYPKGLHLCGVRSWEQKACQSTGAMVRSSSSLATPLPGQCTGMPSAGPCEAGGEDSCQTAPQVGSSPRSPPRRGLILDHSSQRRVSSPSERAPGDVQCETQPFSCCCLPDPLPGCLDRGWQMQNAPPSQHTSPWTTPAPALWCSPGPGEQLAAASERGETHLGTETTVLVIVLEPLPVPKDLEDSPQDRWHSHGTSSQVNHVMDALCCQQNDPPPVQQTTRPRENQRPHIESTAKAVGGSRTLEAQSHRCWGGGDAHRALHLLVLGMAVGQPGSVVGRSAAVLRVTSGVWVESVAGEAGSVSGQSNVTLALSAERCRMLLQLGTDQAKMKPHT